MITCSGFLFSSSDGVSLLNEDGELRVFFPSNSFITNTTLTHTSTPRGKNSLQAIGNDHIVCYGGNPQAAQVTWHNSSGPLQTCAFQGRSLTCTSCGLICENNGGVGQDPPLIGRTNIHIYTESSGYVNQDLECRVSGGQSAFIGVYLTDGGKYNLM